MKIRQRSDLRHYQERTSTYQIEKKRTLCTLQMGMGKTASTLTSIRDLLDMFAVSKVLIIAPLRVANSVWKQEAQQWEHLKDLKFQICTGSEQKRLSALQHEADVYVINRENVVWLVEMFVSIKKFPFDMVVIDESSSFKNSGSKRFKALKKALPFIDYITLLTGTPSPNGLLDLWSQCYLVDYGQALGKTKTAYEKRFFYKDYNGYDLKLFNGAQEKIQNLISDFVLSMQAEDYLELPDCIYLYEKIELDKKTLKLYQDFEENLILKFVDDEVEAMNAASLAGKLMQFCNGAVYTDELKNYEVVHDYKLDALSEIIEENENENILVAYNFKSDLERLTKRFPTARILDNKQQTIDEWNAGNIKLLLAHPQSAGHGLNIQHGGRMIVWFSLNWSLEYYQQFNARLYRQGQTLPVRIIHLICSGCLDERIVNVLKEKDICQSDLLVALKRLSNS